MLLLLLLVLLLLLLLLLLVLLLLLLIVLIPLASSRHRISLVIEPPLSPWACARRRALPPSPYRLRPR